MFTHKDTLKFKRTPFDASASLVALARAAGGTPARPGLCAPRFQFTIQPRARRLPFAQHSARRKLHDFGGFFDTQSAEVAQFHQQTFTRIQLCQRVQRIIQRNNFGITTRRGKLCFFKFDLLRVTTAFRVQARTGKSTSTRRIICAATPRK